MRYLVLALIMLAFPVVCSAVIYKWVDEKGQTGYSDDLGKVPKKYRDSAVVTEKQEQAVEIVEKSEPEKSPRKGETKGEQPVAGDDKAKGKGKPLYDGKDEAAWKQDFGRQKHEIKSLEDQAAGVKERMADSAKISRGEYLTLQNTLKDLDVRIGKSKSRLDALNDAADKAGVPAEFR